MNALLSIYAWVALAVVAIVGFFGQLSVFALTAPFDRRRYWAGRYLRRLGVVIARVSPFWHFEVHGAVPTQIAGNTVCVGNHESHADPFLVSHLPWEMKWLGKASLFRIPFLGWMMRLAGDVPVHRGQQDSARGAMAQCAVWLERGCPVMIFPEGTRSQTEELLPFKDGAFRLAIQSQAQVLPLAVSGTRRALPKHSWRFEKAQARVAVGTPLSTVGMTLDDVPLLKEQARAQIVALRTELQRTLEVPAHSPMR